ncbi:MAG: PD40 domain-containing protein [Bacteroidaceae bacterium]|nr:PD40 domain-containing protein [Bacteroidaceae bacterium]
MNLKKYFLTLFAFCLIGTLSAQTLSQAKKMFDNAEYEKARDAFSKLIKRTPNSAEYNYYYGASLYETGEINQAIPYLEKSAKKNYIGAFRYLGKAYADLYRFDEAVENYETHIEWLVEKDRDTDQAEAELSELRKKVRMFKSVEKVAVIDSFVISKDRFLEAYKISATAGKLQLNDAGNGSIYENEMGNKRIISEMKDSVMQLFTQIKLLDGWHEKEPIESLNDGSNINYPFLMGDGITLYYASDGEGTLGGYDIFVTRYDSEDNTYLRPSNIGMPFNSNANDYMYAIDEFHNLGWFVTDRNQPADTVCVYVFVPNESKVNYNYETTDPQVIKDVATLRSIRTTWTDEDQVRNARQRLATLKYAEKEEIRKVDFQFIIDDSATYTTWDDFRSKEAMETYRKVVQKIKDKAHFEKTLEMKREEYANSNAEGKKKLEPSILDLEKRIPQLNEEISKLIIETRNLEIQKLKQ